MKVIERGQEWAEPWSCVAACGKCKSRLEVEAADVRRMAGDRPWEADSFYAECPVCKNSVYLQTAHVRADVQAQSR